MALRKIKGRNMGYDYFFVKPLPNADAHESAMKLMEIGGVKEVAVTEGAYGFVVKAAQTYGASADSVARKISKAIGGSSTRAMCHCQYTRY